MTYYSLIFMITLLILGGALGWLGNDMYKDWNKKRIYDGLYIMDVNRTTMLEVTSVYDRYGDWVCINVRGMDYKRAIEVCNHEVGHEIFAEIIEKHPEKIPKVMEVIGK